LLAANIKGEGLFASQYSTVSFFFFDRPTEYIHCHLLIETIDQIIFSILYVCIVCVEWQYFFQNETIKQVAPAFRGVCNTEIGRIGTIAHELIHPFGLPEMYDTELGYGTGNIGGIDRFGVMANPAGNSGGDLAWPGHVGAWTRLQLGWVDPIIIDTDGTFEIRPVEQHPDIYKITKGFADKEYLLIENRQPIAGDFDEKFFSPGGIVIYHVDENIWDIYTDGGSVGNYPRGGPFLNGWPGNGKHYPVAILQADGLYELEQGINGGQTADIWNKPSQVLGPGNGEKIATAANNYPNTDSYSFGVINPTGITIRNFQTEPGTNIMTFQVCGMDGGDCPKDGPPDTIAPSKAPPKVLTIAPTKTPTKIPTEIPVPDAIKPPTKTPTKMPTKTPTKIPTPAATPTLTTPTAIIITSEDSSATTTSNIMVSTTFVVVVVAWSMQLLLLIA